MDNKNDPRNLISKTGKNYNYIGDKLIEKRKYLEKNDKVLITSGQHKGLRGIVVQCDEDKKECFIELDNEETVKCDTGEILPDYLELNNNKESNEKEDANTT